MMVNEPGPARDPGQPRWYQIRIQGRLGQQWTGWFEELTLTLEEDGNTLLTGPVIDQAALHGILKKVRDLGIPLLSVTSIGSDSQETPEVKNELDGPSDSPIRQE